MGPASFRKPLRSCSLVDRSQQSGTAGNENFGEFRFSKSIDLEAANEKISPQEGSRRALLEEMKFSTTLLE
jgi:hypothetical protein